MINKTDHIDDTALVLAAQKGDKSAETAILDRYKPLVKVKSRSYFLVGSDQEDLIQEGMIGLYRAIYDFDPEKAASFSTFSELCITRRIISAIKNANRQKHMPLNRCLSFNNTIDGRNSIATYIDILADSKEANPEQLFIFREDKDNLEKKLHEVLSRYEIKVFSLYLKGESYSSIARITQKDDKSVDNALQRIRRKLAQLTAAD